MHKLRAKNTFRAVGRETISIDEDLQFSGEIIFNILIAFEGLDISIMGLKSVASMKAVAQELEKSHCREVQADSHGNTKLV